MTPEIEMQIIKLYTQPEEPWGITALSILVGFSYYKVKEVLTNSGIEIRPSGVFYRKLIQAHFDEKRAPCKRCKKVVEGKKTRGVCKSCYVTILKKGTFFKKSEQKIVEEDWR